MDPRQNPYAPGTGTKPPALVGRDAQIEAFDILLNRLENGYAEQSMIITGLRGVGKTVLLDVFREIAEQRRWATVEWEVEKNSPFGSRMSSQVRRRGKWAAASSSCWTRSSISGRTSSRR